MNVADRSRDTSRELTEVRTVHSRAANALWSITERLDTIRANSPGLYEPADPDRNEMAAALERVVELLSPWARRRR